MHNPVVLYVFNLDMFLSVYTGVSVFFGRLSVCALKPSSYRLGATIHRTVWIDSVICSASYSFSHYLES